MIKRPRQIVFASLAAGFGLCGIAGLVSPIKPLVTVAQAALPGFPPPHIDQIILLYSLVALGTALAICVFPAFRAPDPLVDERWTMVDVAVVLGGAAFIVAFTFLTGNRQFGGYDLSPVIDLGWRQYLGQKPYLDFICTLPIGFVLAVGAAFRIGGPTWEPLVAGAAVLGALAWVWSYVLIRGITRQRTVAALLGATLASCSVLVYGHLFHSLMAAVTGQLAVLSALFVARRPDAISGYVSLAASVAMVLLMKPNTAAPLALGIVVVLVWGSPRKGRVCLAVATGSLGALGTLIAARVNPFDVWHSYLGVSGRAVPDKLFVEMDSWDRAGVSIQLALALLPGIVSFRREGPAARHDSVTLGICMTALVTGLYAMTTNWDVKLADLTFWILAVSAYPLLTSSRRVAARALSMWCLFVFVGIGIAYGVCRTRNRHVGYGAFFEWRVVHDPVPLPFFRYLRTGPFFHQVAKQATEAATTEPGHPIFFGPRMEFMYAALGIEPPRGLPLWWHPGSSYPIEQEPDVVSRWNRLHFSTLVFLRDEFFRIPLGIRQSIARRYTPVSGFATLSVFRRKPQSMPR